MLNNTHKTVLCFNIFTSNLFLSNFIPQGSLKVLKMDSKLILSDNVTKETFFIIIVLSIFDHMHTGSTSPKNLNVLPIWQMHIDASRLFIGNSLFRAGYF